MIIIFFLLWLLLNAHIGLDIAFLEIVLFGIAISFFLMFFMTKFTKWNIAFEKFFLKHFFQFILYGIVLFWNVVTSNFLVIGTILNPKENAEPIIVSMNVPLKNEMLRSILANSITLTPGTITISVTEDHFLIHCLKKEYIEGFEQSTLVKILTKMEEKP